MKQSVALIAIALIIIQCNNSDNIREIDTNLDIRNITEVTNKFFIAIDDNDWQYLERIFNDTLYWDYTSIFGGEPTNWAANQIIDSWKSILPGYDNTHHQLGNYLIEIDSTKTIVFCYVTATHYLENETQNNILTVVGSYELELTRYIDSWRITGVKFDLKYLDGNNDLPNLARERVSK
jgi:hypothetical protein